jgi:hypothetical protein
MLGIVFTEFIEMVEARFSAELADKIILAANLPNQGAYTAVGYYAHDELSLLVQQLSIETGISRTDLVRRFGLHLFHSFSLHYPRLFQNKHSLFDFLVSVDAEIHREVRKLYPQAQLPRFQVKARTEFELQLSYESPRSMEALAFGLIQGAAHYFNEPIQIECHPIQSAQQPASLFVINKMEG